MAQDEEDLLRSVALRNARSIQEARQQAEEALRRQSEWLRITLASIGDAVISTDAEGRVTFLNAVAEGLTGWPQAEAAGRPLAEVFRIVSERTRLPVENPAERALREGTIVGLANHTLLIARDGTERPIDDSAAPIRDGAGAALGAVLVFRDVTERKRAEEARARLAAIVESSDDAIVSKTLDGVIRSWNGGAERLFGYVSAEAVGRSITLIIPPERLDEESRILARLRRGERIDHFETVRLAKDGRRLDISLAVSPIRDDAGRVTGASKVARDITERKRAEALIARDALLLASVRDSVVVTDPEGIVTYWNEGAARLFGWTAPEMLGRHYADRFPEPERSFVREQIRERARGTEWNGEYEDRRKDGSRVWIDARVGPVRDAEGRLVGILGLAQDISARKRAEEALRESDRRKDEFIALLAHELRNPLAPLRNGLRILRLADGDADAAAQARGMMERQLGHMVRLIDDLLDVSRISQHKMELRRSRVSLADVVASAVETARPALDAAGHELALLLPPEPVLLDADLTRLAQVFANLLTNSAKYTPPGGSVRLEAERRGGEAVVSVSDTGIGIPAESLPRIFELFSQVDRSIERETGGLGIGLALVKGLVGMHGGTVTAASAGPGRGSTFTVVLPALPREEEAVAPPAPEPAAGPLRRILVVDDHRDAALSLVLMLKLLGNEVRAAHDGLAGTEEAERFRPEVVLMDVGMPRLNGLDATRRIRSQPWGAGMRIIALTGWGQDEDRARSREAGCDGHLVKPVDLPDLERLLADLDAG
ncbi:MAG: PAS domain S-box protein [Gemmataceae bacterium]|nr:PAS domain S-box protein [Gemmataceae bacterium]